MLIFTYTNIFPVFYRRTVGHWQGLTGQKPSPRHKHKVFVYKRNDEKFREILKFIVRNEPARTALNHLVSHLGTYEVVPNTKDPEALAIEVS